MKNKTEQVINFRYDTTTSLDLFISMQNIALLKAIVSSITESAANGNSKKKDQTSQIVILDNEERADTLQIESAGEEEKSEAIIENKYTINYAFMLAKLNLTVINDLQGLDSAIFKLKLQNTVSKGDIIYKSLVSEERNETDL